MNNRVLIQLLKASYFSGLGSKVVPRQPQLNEGMQFCGTRRKNAFIGCGHRSYSKKSPDEETLTNKKEENSKAIPGSFSDKYAPFKDRQRIVQDVIEEQWNPIDQEFEEVVKIKYERGKTGVFDLPELVNLLEEERAHDVCVIKIPTEYDYADFMIIVSARSPKHMYSLATFVRKRFKSKHLKLTDILPKIEGTKNSTDWVALDLGNIILHIFMDETRERMCLETLWTVGSQYDDLTHRKDSEIVQLLNMFQ